MSVIAIKPIEDDSVFFKALSALPIICLVPCAPNYVSEYSIYGEIISERQPQRLIALFEVKNHYKYSNIASSLTTLILVIVGIAYGIFTSPLVGVLVAAFCISLAAYQIHAVCHNKKMIQLIQNNNFKNIFAR